RFKGKVLKNWEDLAKGLEEKLIARAGVPKQLLDPFIPQIHINKVELGKETTKRVVVGWRNWPRNANRTVYVEETILAFRAEFDVESGELKWLNFHDPQFIGALRQAQSEELGR